MTEGLLIAAAPHAPRGSGGERKTRLCLSVEFHLPDKSGGLNGSTQHLLGVYWQESESLKVLLGVDLSAERLPAMASAFMRTSSASRLLFSARANQCKPGRLPRPSVCTQNTSSGIRHSGQRCGSVRREVMLRNYAALTDRILMRHWRMRLS
jgi:hypothetical protein